MHGVATDALSHVVNSCVCRTIDVAIIAYDRL